jgi:hypothetical protein
VSFIRLLIFAVFGLVSGVSIAGDVPISNAKQSFLVFDRLLYRGNPVYAFLWPEFHVSNRFLKGQNTPANFWRHELEFCRTRADGIVIWGGYQKPWDDQAAWWLETKAFLTSQHSR